MRSECLRTTRQYVGVPDKVPVPLPLSVRVTPGGTLLAAEARGRVAAGGDRGS